MSYYVVIRGPLGVGKSTVSKALAKEIRAVVVSIDALADQHWDGGSLRLYLRTNVAAAARAKPALDRGTPVVFDGCFYWKTQIQDLERLLPEVHRVFTLRAPLRVCIERDEGRRVTFGAEATAQVYRKTSRFEYGVPIDANGALSETVREIRARLPPRPGSSAHATRLG